MIKSVIGGNTVEEVKILTLGSFLQLRFESLMGHIQCQHNVDYEGQRPHFLDEGIPYMSHV